MEFKTTEWLGRLAVDRLLPAAKSTTAKLRALLRELSSRLRTIRRDLTTGSGVKALIPAESCR